MYDQYRGVGISHARPLTLEEKGALLALGTLMAPHAIMALGGGWKTLGLVRKALTWGVIPFALSPGGGGPRTYPTSTTILLDAEGWSNPLLRGYRPTHGY